MGDATTHVHVRLPSHRCLTVDVPARATAADVVALALPHMRSDAAPCMVRAALVTGVASERRRLTDMHCTWTKRVWHRGRVLEDSHPVLAHVRHGDTLQVREPEMAPRNGRRTDCQRRSSCAAGWQPPWRRRRRRRHWR